MPSHLPAADLPDFAGMGAGHDLHQTASAHPTDSPLLERGFYGDDGENEFRLHLVRFAAANRRRHNLLRLVVRDLIPALDVSAEPGDPALLGGCRGAGGIRGDEFHPALLGGGCGYRHRMGGVRGLLTTDCLQRLSQSCCGHQHDCTQQTRLKGQSKPILDAFREFHKTSVVNQYELIVLDGFGSLIG